MVTTKNMFHATYIKMKGVKLGKVTKGKDGVTAFELDTTEENFNRLLNEYDNNDEMPIKKFIDELGYVKYLIKTCK